MTYARNLKTLALLVAALGIVLPGAAIGNPYLTNNDNDADGNPPGHPFSFDDDNPDDDNPYLSGSDLPSQFRETVWWEKAWNLDTGSEIDPVRQLYLRYYLKNDGTYEKRIYVNRVVLAEFTGKYSYDGTYLKLSPGKHHEEKLELRSVSRSEVDVRDFSSGTRKPYRTWKN